LSLKVCPTSLQHGLTKLTDWSKLLIVVVVEWPNVCVPERSEVNHAFLTSLHTTSPHATCS
jgi:hypothetical protein